METLIILLVSSIYGLGIAIIPAGLLVLAAMWLVNKKSKKELGYALFTFGKEED